MSDPGQTNVILRNALRISCSASEYKLLHDHLIRKLPDSIQSRSYSPADFNAVVESKRRYIDAAVRSSIRIFLCSATGLKLADIITRRITRKTDVPTSALRLPFSLSLIFLFHRLLYRFFTRLRANLRTDDAHAFRERNPRVSKALISRYAPAIGASLAGFLLGLSPQGQLRNTVAIYTLSRSLEFSYNALVEKGWFKSRPWWFGSWLLMPLSMAQLFHAFIFDRETEPKWFGDFILKFTPEYVQQRPVGYPSELSWPDKYEIVDSLGKISELRWPPFTSPILHPDNPCTLPAAVKSIAPITSPAHPAMSSLSCVLLHPKSPSCLTAFLHQTLLSIPPLTRFLTKVYLALSLLKLKSFLLRPVDSINLLCRKVLCATAVLSASIGTAWGSVCLFNSILPRSVLSTQRFYLSGALGGLPFALFNGDSQRGHFLYFLRVAIDSAWKVGVKRGLWRGYKGGDLWVIVASWALIGALLEGQPNSISSGGIRKGLAWMKGDGYSDPAENRPKKKGKKTATD